MDGGLSVDSHDFSVDSRDFSAVNLLKIVLRVFKDFMSNGTLVKKAIGMLLVIPSSGRRCGILALVGDAEIRFLAENHFKEYVTLLLKKYAGESFISVFLQLLSRFISEGSLRRRSAHRVVQNPSIELPFVCEDLDVLELFLTPSNVESIVPAVFSYLEALAAMPSMARLFFESDIAVRLTSVAVQLTNVAVQSSDASVQSGDAAVQSSSSMRHSRLNKINQVISILSIFSTLARQRSSSLALSPPGELLLYLVESGVGEVILHATNRLNANTTVVGLVVDILEGLFTSPEICQYFCLCNYSRVLQTFFTLSIRNEDCVRKALKCTIALLEVDSGSSSSASL